MRNRAGATERNRGIGKLPRREREREKSSSSRVYRYSRTWARRENGSGCASLFIIPAASIDDFRVFGEAAARLSIYIPGFI